MKKCTLLLSMTLLLSVILLLAACGGGGGGGGPELTLTPSDFTDLSNQIPGEAIESDAIVVSGITDPVTISVANGRYAIKASGNANYSPWTTESGTIAAGSSVKVSPNGGTIATEFTDVTVTLTIGSKVVTFKATTGPSQQTTPDS